MRPMPVSFRNKLASKKFYEKCCVCSSKPVQWHHNLIFKGRQENEEFCLLPLCVPCHDQARNKEFKEKLDWIMWNRATDAQINYYSKATNYKHERNRLNNKFGSEWKNPIKEE